VWIEPVIAQEMMTLRAGTVFSFYGAVSRCPERASANAREATRSLSNG
jgi:hypothetical protein